MVDRAPATKAVAVDVWLSPIKAPADTGRTMRSKYRIVGKIADNSHFVKYRSEKAPFRGFFF
jgi:hypothetical protein